MAFSSNKYTGDGSTTNFGISYEYISQDHIKVYVDNVDTAFTWVNSTTVQVSPAPTSGAIVVVKRETPKNILLVDFENASILEEADLDLANQQAQFVAQEAFDEAEESLQEDLTGNFDAESKKIVNVADPTADQDACTKAYSDASNASGYATAAAASASAASTSETNAAASASAASTSETNAATSEANAAASYDSFDDRYLGEKASDPTLDNDGNALLTGALYWNNVSNEMRVYTGSAWQQAYNASSGITDNAGSTAITITAGLSVGIGEVIPLGKLHVKSGDNGLGAALGDADEVVIEGSSHSGINILSGAGTYGTIAFGDNALANSGFMRYRHDSNSWQLATNGAVAITVDSSQNVGINELTPLGKLHVKTSDSAGSVHPSADELVLESSSVAGATISSVTSGHIWFGDAAATNIGRINYTHSTNHMDFWVNNAEQFRITSAGNFGVGETVPLGKFHIKSGDSTLGSVNVGSNELVLEDSGSCGMTIIAGGSGNACNIDFADSASAGIGAIVYNHSQNALFLKANSLNALKIDSSQNIIIASSDEAGAAKAIAMANGTAPSGTPVGGGVIYVESGALKYKGSTGTITTLGVA